MEHAYKSLLAPFPPQVAESPQRYTSFSERHLQALWFEQKYFKGLTTTDNRPVTVISPGLWNGEAGPDFKKAHLFIGDKEIRGDIELHLSEEGWRQHNHHLDPRYNDVALHISLWKPKKSKTLFTTEKRALLQTYMEPFFTIPLSRISKLIDLDLYPYKTVAGCGQCSQQLFRKLSTPAIQSLFKHAAEWRLTQKFHALQDKAENFDQCLPLGLAMGLGYKNNAQSFLELYNALKGRSELSEKALFSYALGICGFFASKHRKRWEKSTYYQELLSTFATSSIEEGPKISLSLHQIRPFNHPIRRIAYMVKMLKDVSLPQLTRSLFSVWENNWEKKNSPRGWSGLRILLEGMIPNYHDTYWNRCLSFCSKPSTKELPLLGKSGLQEILINTFLPMLFARISNRSCHREKGAFFKFYNAFPAKRTGKSLYLKQRFFGDSSKGELMNSAEIEQGTYQVHHDFCLHYEASCVTCPFVHRYRRENNHASFCC